MSLFSWITIPWYVVDENVRAARSSPKEPAPVSATEWTARAQALRSHARENETRGIGKQDKGAWYWESQYDKTLQEPPPMRTTKDKVIESGETRKAAHVASVAV